MNSASELRLDLVSNDWVVIATGRGKRPETFAKHKRAKEMILEKDCPFCQTKILEEQGIKLRHDKPDGSWSLLVVDNKYPAFSKGEEPNERTEGPNKAMNGLGFHEVIVTRDHKKQMAQFSKEEIREVIDAYQSRYLDLMKEKFIKYISIFHNHKKEAGATVAHPHSQLIAIPVMDPDLRGSLEGAEMYYQKNRKCVYCAMIDWDIKDGQRVVYENDKFIVLCPFASQVSFEVRIYPKEHSAYFEKMSEEEKDFFTDAFRVALNKIYQGLNDPAYNFYFHTAPLDSGSYKHYHWHLIILPKTAVWAGFELGTGIEISTIEPEKAAEFLKKQ
ncbi:MAG: hypothetical protein A3A94_02060 [Candidatus Portnoybacteria bacterium RIFCSPLOWO2_01_FULL_43_11]|uniref:DUF4921 domain-containing protein n=4 Tax=Candidatus Portnoyibacteriota TaxID=1817913 RepID=A0A1G2FCJ9_9BACT|nr:MAG: hypothetical protein A2815_01865 [Candidatus Portnoybacteria bacterium RIFCSPHIGHO2_01_FULL_40_12b]OGZ37155.1 MAG: hypothetical protein A3D38_01280 [Candidatus Portnoybacteria bacterium RIFCSPHIGHO2_02_FULL_40_23]OGZ37696.1 MAG: hypothetical protein A3E90_00205 [Candidatus Portnoybacteria bacterium RIFCSPHIGHO2_12_FULL_40_11]OGZ38801.1 MAG: hypothetical protein A3A94_02060 [Candidatus Portnoybacteria bacterium RIFCSPLOWO2_01_FULL_43_11]OGZ40390.1 MAG: hypothetical protein A3I20_01765 [C